MAIHTAIGFSLISFGIFVWLWYNLEKKLQLITSIQSRMIFMIVIPVIIIFSSVSFYDIKKLKIEAVDKIDAEFSVISYQITSQIDKKFLRIEEVAKTKKYQKQNSKCKKKTINFELTLS